MKKLSPHQEIQNILNTYNFDIGKCINLFIEEYGFDGVVVYKDSPGFNLPSHFHKSDDHIYMLDGELLVEINGEIHCYKKSDYFIIQKGVIHSVKPGGGGKYIVATENGDFDTIYV